MKKPSSPDKQPIGHRFSWSPPITLTLGEAAQPGRLFGRVPVSPNAALLEGMAALAKQIQDLAARSTQPQVLGPPAAPRQGMKPIPTNVNRGCLLKVLNSLKLIDNADIDGIVGHFDSEAPQPSLLVGWKQDGVSLAAFFVASAVEGIFGVSGRNKLSLPPGAQNWAVDHFALLQSDGSYRRVGEGARDPRKSFSTAWQTHVRLYPEKAQQEVAFLRRVLARLNIFAK